MFIACTTRGNHTEDIYREVPIKNARTSVTISSPNFPNPYPRNMQCTWRILAPSDYKVQLSFLEFKLEESYLESGCHDYISVRLVVPQALIKPGLVVRVSPQFLLENGNFKQGLKWYIFFLEMNGTILFQRISAKKYRPLLPYCLLTPQSDITYFSLFLLLFFLNSYS